MATTTGHRITGHRPGHGVAEALGRYANAEGAYRLLRTVFAVAPILFGLDKFTNWLTDWENYLAPWVNDIVPGSAHDAMLAVGVIEIAAGVLVALWPTYGAPIVAVWLAGIILNLLTIPDYYDIALRDFGLLVAAVALSLLAWERRPGHTS